MKYMKVRVYLSDKKALINGVQTPVSRTAYMLATHKEHVRTTREGAEIYKYFGKYVDGSEWKLSQMHACVPHTDVVSTNKPIIVQKPYHFVPAFVFQEMEKADIEAEKAKKSSKPKSHRSRYPVELNSF